MQTHTVNIEEIANTVDFNFNVIKLMFGKDKMIISDKAKEKIIQHALVNGLTDIESILEEAVKNCSSTILDPQNVLLKSEVVKSQSEFPIGLKLEDLERKYILQTLYFVKQNRTKAAEVLGISIRTLRNKINQYRLEGYL